MFNDKYLLIIERGDDKKIILENEKFILDCIMIPRYSNRVADT